MPLRLTTLSSGDICSLTEVLQLNPNDTDPIHYNNRIAALIEALPSRLKSNGFLNRITKPALPARSRMLDPLDQRGPLCPMHHKLDASMVQKVFTLLALEVGHHLNHVARHCHLLTGEQQKLISRLRALHAIWYQPEQYERFFLEPSKDTRWTYQGNKCAACTLARIAGNLDALLDLLCAVSSRTSSNEKHKQPRLYDWLVAWIENHGEALEERGREKLQVLVQDVWNRSFALKQKRKEFSKARKEFKQGVGSDAKGEAVEPQEGANIQMYDHFDDDQLESVNVHTALMSTPHLPDMARFHQEESQRSGRDESNLAPPRASAVSRTRSTRRDQKTYGGNHSPASPLTARPEEYTPPRARWRTSDDAAKSYANVIGKTNPFATRNTVRDPMPNPKAAKPTNRNQKPSPSTRASTSPESVWTDCEPQATAKSSLSSLFEKYANYGGLPDGPDLSKPPSARGTALDNDRTPTKAPPATDLPLRRHATTAQDKHHRKQLDPNELLKRAASTSTAPRERHTHNAAGAGAARRTTERPASVHQPDTRPSSSLIGKHKHDRDKPTSTAKKSPSAVTEKDEAVTCWDDVWRDDVLKKPENKFYKDRLEREEARWRREKREGGGGGEPKRKESRRGAEKREDERRGKRRHGEERKR
ncbi:uncharacterized protein HMPREF1541_01838 [Cyphellophora europaea CBS 101466]|uniref:Uncharacterized protein n=1 Tax=Cyphellophora europaea (strain CBS 101466) TaxID=1220924 RepID=W2S1T3_CYPE1|nr:uncharacterized protein HMPREF1541_01838 [Cyphellophora europaea CBS 101466]ETN42681.1 hypothetical protein HMPREF1541_01838 [Cyphellophora europaea CBS 101466]